MSVHPLLFSRHHSHPLHLLRGAPFPDCLFPFFLKFKPKPSSGCVSPDPLAIHQPFWMCPDKGKGAAARLLELLQPPPPPPPPPQPRASLFLPPRLAHGDPAPSSLTDPHPALLALTAARGPVVGLLRRETRAGRPWGRGPEETQERLWPRRRPRAGLVRGGSGGSGLRGRGSPARPPARPLPRPARQGAGNAAASARLNSNCHRGRLPSPPPGRRAPGPPPPCRAARPSGPQGVPQLGRRPPGVRASRAGAGMARRPGAEAHPWCCS